MARWRPFRRIRKFFKRILRPLKPPEVTEPPPTVPPLEELERQPVGLSRTQEYMWQWLTFNLAAAGKYPKYSPR